MTHLEAENLASDYLEGDLEQAQRADFEAHLGICSECRGLVAGVRRAIELCRTAEELVPAPWLASKILLATVGQRPDRASALRSRGKILLRPSGGVRTRIAVSKIPRAARETAARGPLKRSSSGTFDGPQALRCFSVGFDLDSK